MDARVEVQDAVLWRLGLFLDVPEEGRLGAKKLDGARRHRRQALEASREGNEARTDHGTGDAGKIRSHLVHQGMDARLDGGCSGVESFEARRERLQSGHVRIREGGTAAVRAGAGLGDGFVQRLACRIGGHELGQPGGIVHGTHGFRGMQGGPFAQALDQEVGGPLQVVQGTHFLREDPVGFAVALHEPGVDNLQSRLVQDGAGWPLAGCSLDAAIQRRRIVRGFQDGLDGRGVGRLAPNGAHEGGETGHPHKRSHQTHRRAGRRVALRLETSITGIEFPNPLLLASGVLNETGASMARARKEGAGGVVTKSMGAKPRPGHANPTVVEVDGGLLNAMGLPGPGVHGFLEEMAEAKEAGTVLVGSVFGGTPEEFAQNAAVMAPHVAGLELNVSCPHAKGYGSEIGGDPVMLGRVVEAVKEAVSVPVWAKLTPNTGNIVALGQAAADAGADALVATNTLKAISIEPDVRMPVLGNKVGGLSGHALKPVSLRAVWDLHAAGIGVPIVASGGIYTARDVLEYAMAGASAFQIGTALLHEGWGVFGTVARDLEAWAAMEGVGALGEIQGAAHP